MIKKPDYILLGTVIALVVLGIFILFSISGSYSWEKFGSPYSFFLHQIIYGLLPGLILGFIAFKIPLDKLKKISFPLLILNIVLLGLVFTPVIGMSSGGAHRWLNLRVITFQPAELLKITFILYLASWISKWGSNSGSLRDKNKYQFTGFFLPFIIVLGIISFLLIKQPDISTLGIIGSTALVMYFVAATPVWQTFSLLLVAASALIILIKLAPYRLNRFLVFLNPSTDPMGIGYHIKQALIAVGSGGIIGVGLGMSRQKFGFLPQSIGDSIFAIFSEETGFIGAFILISLFAILAWRGFLTAKNSSDKFSQLLAVGITAWITIQAFINIASTIAIFPLSGIPLPFISYGGTALINELVAMGLLLNVSKRT